jgi:hypothetical protein
VNWWVTVFIDGVVPLRPKPPFQPMTLRGGNIVAILVSRCAQTTSRSIRAAQLSGRPFGGL